jgi:hypothetical protein
LAKGQANTAASLASCAATTNSTLVSNVPVDLYTIIATNTTAAVKYLKLYNRTTAPTVGVAFPVLTIALQPSNVPTVISIPSGMYFNAGLAYALTGLAAQSDATALVAGDVVGVNLLYC